MNVQQIYVEYIFLKIVYELFLKYSNVDQLY